MAAAFYGKTTSVKKDADAVIQELYTKIGQLTVEKDFLEQAFAKRRVASEGVGWSSVTIHGSVFADSAEYSRCPDQLGIVSAKARSPQIST
jgi:hypothetical protein